MNAASGRPGHLVGEIAETLRTRILRGDYALGEPIRETQLAAELKVSRAPVREAMRLLEERGMVVKMLRSSYAVTRLGQRDVIELVSLRQTLEVMAGELAFGRTGLATLLRDAVAVMQAGVDVGDYQAVMAANRAFHRVIVTVADHERLAQAYDRLSDQIEMSYLLYPSRRPDILHIVDHHLQLIRLVEAGDRAAFLAELRAHVGMQLTLLSNAR